MKSRFYSRPVSYCEKSGLTLYALFVFVCLFVSVGDKTTNNFCSSKIREIPNPSDNNNEFRAKFRECTNLQNTKIKETLRWRGKNDANAQSVLWRIFLKPTSAVGIAGKAYSRSIHPKFVNSKTMPLYFIPKRITTPSISSHQPTDHNRHWEEESSFFE